MGKQPEISCEVQYVSILLYFVLTIVLIQSLLHQWEFCIVCIGILYLAKAPNAGVTTSFLLVLPTRGYPFLSIMKRSLHECLILKVYYEVQTAGCCWRCGGSSQIRTNIQRNRCSNYTGQKATKNTRKLGRTQETQEHKVQTTTYT